MPLAYLVLVTVMMPEVLRSVSLEAPTATMQIVGLLVLGWTALEVGMGLAAWVAQRVPHKPRTHGHPPFLPLSFFLAGLAAVAAFALGRQPENALRYDLVNALGVAAIALGGLLSLRNVNLSLQTLASPGERSPRPAPGFTAPPVAAAPRSAAPATGWTFARLRALSSREFEQLVAWMYQAEESDARLTPAGNDGGWDIEVVQGTRRLFVECKNVDTVGTPILRSLHPAVSSHRASKGVLVTTGRCTSDAHREAGRLHLELVDGTQVLMRLNALAAQVHTLR
ncbi:restriction endonuclease [Deinococcus arcticus]|uniref:Restriction endonuclease type IV Mrr domain-containing protein n=1 Tax=Deinococcus arcticus TaxID=2136176 RepID=A0A2T3W3Y6_9DEIO|nr:restriction endonuclease [Deinococcus arcticus]PTA66605.1 hypothetical protein C8263_17030 [Deinococcus arcticus]